MTGPLPRWADETCVICPAQELGPGAFNVVARPGPELVYRPDVGWRVDRDGTAVCVHPFRVGMPPGAYASAGMPLPPMTGTQPQHPKPEALELPDRLEDLEGWLVAVLRTAEPDQIFAAVSRAERQAAQRFPAGAVVQALRRVLSHELARR